MKKNIFALFLTVVMCLSLAACGAKKEETPVAPPAVSEPAASVEDPGVDAHYGSFLSADDGANAQVQVSGQPNLQKLGSYTVTYTATYRGKTATVERLVTIVDTQKPTISLIYNSNSFTLPGADGTYRAYSQSGEFLMLAKRENDVLYTVKSFFEV